MRDVFAAIPLDDISLNWNHIYLLAWWDTRRPYFTTWTDTLDSLYARVVVVGPILPFGPPMWDAPVQHKRAPWLPAAHYAEEYKLYLIRTEEDWKARTRELGGVRALGWYIKDGFQRGFHAPECHRVHKLGERPCWG